MRLLLCSGVMSHVNLGHKIIEEWLNVHVFRKPNMENTQEKSAPKMIRKPRTITESSSSSDTTFSPSSLSSSSSADMMEAMDRIALEWGQEEETEEEFELRRRLEFAQ